ncbi:MAG: hypothetical protein VZS44_06760 [Bacilli bacterium]|nr:hypothetical protein [Bacilli bacterium]
MEYIAKVLKTNLGYKYDLNTDFYDTKGYLSPFNNNSLLGEGLNEMYASLFSGVLEYNLGSKNDGAILKQNSRKDDNRVRTSYRRNCFNGYGQSKYFYILRVLVSKKSIFNSLYLGKDDMIDEFCIKYKDILNNYEKKFGSSIKVYNYSNNFFKNLLSTIGYIYMHIQNVESYINMKSF